MQTTITEALAELKTISKRIQQKQESIKPYVAREDKVRDPLADQGGSKSYIERELQSIGDLNERRVAIRLAIQAANRSTVLKIGPMERSVAGWLTWRKEIAPEEKSRLEVFRGAIMGLRQDCRNKGRNVVAVGAAPVTPEDVLVNIDEVALHRQIEQIESILGELDGKLSLLNATTVIDV